MFGLPSIFCAPVIFTIIKNITFVSYKYIALSFFSCKVILCNLWTEPLQHLRNYIIAKAQLSALRLNHLGWECNSWKKQAVG